MNAIRQTALLNKRELENAVPPSASWHVDYRDTAWLYVGGFPLDLSEGDVVTIFSQFGNPTHLNLIRDKETGKSKGFGFLKYEDQRSCDLAVDNFGGADVLGRLLRVDHTRYKKKDGEDEETYRIERLEREGGAGRVSDTESEADGGKEGGRKRTRMLKEERELARIEQAGDDEDPMRDYLIKEKMDEAERARKEEKRRKHRHHHTHRHRDRDGAREDGNGEDSRRRHRHRPRYRSPSDTEDKPIPSTRRRDRDHDDDHDRYRRRSSSPRRERSPTRTKR